MVVKGENIETLPLVDVPDDMSAIANAWAAQEEAEIPITEVAIALNPFLQGRVQFVLEKGVVFLVVCHLALPDESTISIDRMKYIEGFCIREGVLAPIKAD